MGKFFKLLGFFSTIGALIALCWTYAYLPLMVKGIGFSGSELSIGKHNFFYWALALISTINLIFYFINSFLRSKQRDQETTQFLDQWIGDFLLLKVAIELFLITAIVFIGLYNHLDTQKLTNLSYLLYIGIGGIIIWFLYFISSLFSRFKPA